MNTRPGRYAAIDIGTVTCRLLVADVDSTGGIEELHRDYAICNLGVGVDKTGRLAPEAIERTGAAVARFVGAIDALHRAYHDAEWGVPVHDEAWLMEQIANADASDDDSSNEKTEATTPSAKEDQLSLNL